MCGFLIFYMCLWMCNLNIWVCYFLYIYNWKVTYLCQLPMYKFDLLVTICLLKSIELPNGSRFQTNYQFKCFFHICIIILWNMNIKEYFSFETEICYLSLLIVHVSSIVAVVTLFWIILFAVVFCYIKDWSSSAKLKIENLWDRNNANKCH